LSAWTCRSSDGKAAQKIVPPRLRIPYWNGPGADSEEKHEPASDTDTAVVDSLKALDLERPIREADIHFLTRRRINLAAGVLVSTGRRLVLGLEANMQRREFIAFLGVSLPKTRFVHTGDAIRPRLHVRQCLRSARSGVCLVHPSRSKHEDATHYNRWRIS
jgi:hypothetical protein